jgi:hypothetical protein
LGAVVVVERGFDGVVRSPPDIANKPAIVPRTIMSALKDNHAAEPILGAPSLQETGGSARFFTPFTNFPRDLARSAEATGHLRRHIGSIDFQEQIGYALGLRCLTTEIRHEAPTGRN